MFLALGLLGAAAVLQGIAALLGGWRNARYALEYVSPRAPAERVLVMCPVKGAEADLEVNARSLVEQSHPDFEVVFIVESRSDPAFSVLRRVTGRSPWVAGPAQDRGQKVHNLARAVQAFGDEAPIWVFADIDARFPSNWLRELVAPLSDRAVGASTGYRWYTPATGALAERLRSAWNASVAGVLGPSGGNFAWGGSTAIRRETFEQARVADAWRGAVSDDYALTRALGAIRRPIVFVPTCLVPSFGRCSLRQLLEFTTRQVRITRVYAPRVFWLGLATYTIFNAAFILLFAAALVAPWLWAPWAVIYGLALARSELRLRAARRAIRDGSIEQQRWFLRLSAPLVALLYQYNFLSALASRRIVWKGVGYTLVSPAQTRIDHGDASPNESVPAESDHQRTARPG